MRLIEIKDFDEEGNLNPETLGTISLDTLPDRYLVRRGDVLFVSRGVRLVAAPVLVELPNTAASSYLFRIRLTTDAVEPAFLAWCLNHAPGEEFLRSCKQGSHLPYVSLAHLAEFPVPVPLIAVQRRIVELDRLRQEENRLTRRLRELRAKRLEHFSLSLLKSTVHSDAS
jgi:restriction endonuclease S subunit